MKKNKGKLIRNEFKISKSKKKDLKKLNSLYYKLHPIEEKENREKEIIINLLKSDIKSIVLKAEDENDNCIGFLLSLIISYGNFKYGSIEELFVIKKYRNKEIGSNLIKEIIKEMKKLKVRVVIIETDKNNLSTKKLYKKLGFTNTGGGHFKMVLKN